MRCMVCFFGILCLILCSTNANAEVVTLVPTEVAAITGETEAGDMEARLLLDFDLSTIPPEAIVTDASLYFRGFSVSDELGSICIYAAQVTADWDSEDADWNGPGNDADWEQPGGDWIYDFGDYDCLSAESSGEARLNLTTMMVHILQKPEEFEGLILFPMEYPDNSLNLQMEILRMIQIVLEIEYYLDTDIGGGARPDRRVAD